MGRVNKLKIALVTDSTSVLTDQEVKNNDINVVPIPVIVGDKEYSCLLYTSPSPRDCS